VTNTYAVIFSVAAFAAACAGSSETAMTDARVIAPTDASNLAIDGPLASDADSDARADSAPDGRSEGTIDADRPAVTTSPWPESCVPPDNLPRPAGQDLLTGPAGSASFGEPAGPGESMTAKLNGYVRSFGRFQTNSGGLVGYGFDGSIALMLPSFAVGTYACPAAGIGYANLSAGSRDSNAAASRTCCTIQIARSGAVGEIVEGTFSGILIHGPLISWIKVEDGHFAVVRR
jgi:hypothetical protein